MGSKRPFPLRTVLTVVGVIVVALLLGAGVRYWQTRSQGSVPVDRTDAAVLKSQTLSMAGDFTGAQAVVTDALKQKGLSTDQKYQLYYCQGNNYQNHGNVQQALESFKKAATYKQTQSLYESMASLAQSLGDNQSAIVYYKKAITLIPSNKPTAAEDKATDQQIIQALGGKP
ncbi:MAG TPA: hypothetical protein VLH84_03030 [Patescibacteria group bacterium]|nr:hypothetical protein [Patescibacteria group bacterium]